MFRKDLLKLVRARPSDEIGLSLSTSTSDEMLETVEVRSSSGETYRIHDGYLDLLGRRPVGDNPANFTNYLPGAGGLYEPLWRVRSLSLLTGEDFPNERELEIVSRVVNLTDGGLFLDLGCSAGLYTRNFAPILDGKIIGIDIAPSMLKEAARKAKTSLPVQDRPSFVRADAKELPFADGVFDGAMCGGSLNEFGDPARVLRETARVTQSGGRIAIMGILRAATKNGRRLQKFLSTGGIKFFERDEVTSILDHADFEPDPLRTFGPVFFASGERR